jgi:glycine/D-amino acid oxidase-like deaminating enzyme
VPDSSNLPRWGETPWVIDFHPEPAPLPEALDFVVIGGGFTGLSVAACLRSLNPEKTVAVFEAVTIGARSSGHTGGLTLNETAAGDLPGLGDVLTGFAAILGNLDVHCDLTLPGVFELDRATEAANSAIHWTDSGRLRVAKEVPGGTANPGKLVSGLARAAAARGAMLFENARVDRIDYGDHLTLEVRGRRIRTERILVATNAESLEMSGLAERADPKLTLAMATRPVSDRKLQSLGLDSRKPFYTTDLPYLWGRLLNGNQIMLGSGLVSVDNWGELANLDVGTGEARALMDRLEKRVHRLHPALADVDISHRWAGPILIAKAWRPIFTYHPKDSRIIVLGAYSGHGVALSVYLGKWAAEALLNQRELPAWNAGA